MHYEERRRSGAAPKRKMMQRLTSLHERICNCSGCRLSETYNPVPGEGPASPVMLVGQNPGAQEDKTGRPFDGPAGRVLDELLIHAGMRRPDLYITSIVKCRTPSNRPPRREEIEACLPHLTGQIQLIGPRMVVLMGRCAWRAPRHQDTRYIQTYHPAAALRSRLYRHRLFEQFGRLRRCMP